MSHSLHFSNYIRSSSCTGRFFREQYPITMETRKTSGEKGVEERAESDPDADPVVAAQELGRGVFTVQNAAAIAADALVEGALPVAPCDATRYTCGRSSSDTKSVT